MARDVPSWSPRELLRHREWVRRIARDLARDANRADDLEQQTWLAALTSRPGRGGSARAWLGTVLRNWLRRGMRTDGRRRRRERVAARSELLPATDDVAADHEVHRRVARAVLDLGEPHRSLVLLRFYEGLTVREAAERQGIPFETARSRLKTALARIRARLETNGTPPAWGAAFLGLFGPRNHAAAGGWTTSTGVVAVTTSSKLAVVCLVVSVASVTAWSFARPPSLEAEQAQEIALLRGRVALAEQDAADKDRQLRGARRKVGQLRGRLAEPRPEPVRDDPDPEPEQKETAREPILAVVTEAQPAGGTIGRLILGSTVQAAQLDVVVDLSGTEVQYADFYQSAARLAAVRFAAPASRWQKVKKALGLSDSQLNELRWSVAKRDATYENAVSQVVRPGVGGPEIHREVETWRLDDADHIFRAEVEGILTRQQGKEWSKARHADAFVKKRPQPGLVSSTLPQPTRLTWVRAAAAQALTTAPSQTQ